MTSRYFRLLDDVHIAGRWHLGEVKQQGGFATDLLDTCPAHVERLEVAVSAPGRELAFCLSSFATPVATTELAGAMAGVAGSDLECIPLLVDGRTGYLALNALRSVKALDERSSEFAKWTPWDHRPELAGTYRRVVELRIDAAAIEPKLHLFRLEGWSIALIVSEKMKAAMERAGCLGAKFEEVA
jgi:hypothetical protein